jgi:hypothetical protein
MGDSSDSVAADHRMVSELGQPADGGAALSDLGGVWHGLSRLLAWGRREWSPVLLLQSFRWCFAIKLLCTFYSTYAEPIWPAAPAVVLRALAVASTLAMCRRKTAWLGGVGWLGLVAAHVTKTWPYTLNHFFLELLFLLVLCAYPSATREGREASAGEARSLLFLAILSVWFFSGVQKLAQGHFLNGEAFALQLLSDDSALGIALCGGLTALVQGMGIEASMAVLPPAAPGFGAFTRAYCLLSSWLLPLAECALPLWAALGPRRELAVAALVVGQLVIATASGEHDFALTGVAALGLAWSRWVQARHFALAAAAVLLFLERALG